MGTKIARQPHADTMRPETTGPKAGPRVIIMPPTERYVPSFARGATARTVLIIVGMNTPVPTDWMSRSMSSIQNVVLTIAPMKPTMRNAEATMNSRRAPRRR